ncbi:hypothetical protein VUR80DRAFT_8016 [Thermomyces stellatus]
MARWAIYSTLLQPLLTSLPHRLLPLQRIRPPFAPHGVRESPPELPLLTSCYRKASLRHGILPTRNTSLQDRAEPERLSWVAPVLATLVAPDTHEICGSGRVIRILISTKASNQGHFVPTFGFDGRTEESFRPASAEFDHGSAQAIGIIAGFICGRLESACGAGEECGGSL